MNLKTKNMFIILCFFSIIITAQVEHSRNVFSKYSPQFFIDIAQYKSEKIDETKTDIFIQIPYSHLKFLKIGDGYQSRYRVSFELMDEDKEIVQYQIAWKERVFVKDFKASISSKNSSYSYKSLSVKPGNYFIRIKIEDRDSRDEMKFEQEIKIREFKHPFAMSDIVLVDRKIKTKNGEQIVPNVSLTFSNDVKEISFFYNIYSEVDTSLTVNYDIVDVENETKSTYPVMKTLHKGNNLINESLSGFNINLGDYKILARITDKNNNDIRAVEKKFLSILNGFPPSIRNLREAVEQMIYIAGQDQVDFILDSKDSDEMLKRYKEYWQTADPTVGTEENEILTEYYRRVEYSNQNFTGYFNGWKSDMGMIYITLGPPNQVERHPFDDNSKPYEVWTYYDINQQFVFVDNTGFGDYRLYNPVYGDWYRYRQ